MVQTWRAHVSHCLCVFEKDGQNERTIHTFPQTNHYCLPPTGKQREQKQEQESYHKSYFTVCSSSSPSSPTLASLALGWEDDGCGRVKSPAVLWSSRAKFVMRSKVTLRPSERRAAIMKQPSISDCIQLLFYCFSLLVLLFFLLSTASS